VKKTLVMDPETREMRVVYADLWDGQHERTEFRVTAERGGPVVRNRPEWDGATVDGTVPGLYVKALVPDGRFPVWTEETAVGPTVKVPCPKATNPRRKCALCTAA